MHFRRGNSYELIFKINQLVVDESNNKQFIKSRIMLRKGSNLNEEKKQRKNKY